MGEAEEGSGNEAEDRDGDEGGRESVRVPWEGETVKGGAEIDAVNNGLISHPLLGKRKNVKKIYTAHLYGTGTRVCYDVIILCPLRCAFE